MNQATTPNWKHHSKKEQKRTLKPQAMRQSKAKLKAFKMKMKTITVWVMEMIIIIVLMP